MTFTTADLVDRAHDGLVDEIDPAPRPKRRTFTAAEKLAHLDAYDALEKGSSQRGRTYAARVSTRRTWRSGPSNATGVPCRGRRRSSPAARGQQSRSS